MDKNLVYKDWIDKNVNKAIDKASIDNFGYNKSKGIYDLIMNYKDSMNNEEFLKFIKEGINYPELLRTINNEDDKENDLLFLNI